MTDLLPLPQITLTPTVGELIRAVQMPESAFAAEVSKLRGMNETTASASITSVDADTVRRRIYAATNVLQVGKYLKNYSRLRDPSFDSGGRVLTT